MPTWFDNFLSPPQLYSGSGMTPQQVEAAQLASRRALALGLLGNVGTGRNFAAGLAQGLAGAQSTYQGAMENAYRHSVLQKEEERRKAQEERAQKDQELQMKQQEIATRQNSAITAGRLSTGISSAADPMGYWNLVRSMPEVQDTMRTYQIDPAAITTPEQLTAVSKQLGVAGAIGGPLRQPTPLQLVRAIDPKTGKAVYMTEQQALGMTPAGGQGFNVTLPDGTTVSMGEQGSQVGPGELAKPTVNNLQETIVNSSNRLDRLNLLLNSYRPEYLQARGLFKAGTTELKDFLGMDIPDADKQFLRGYSEFKASSSQEFSSTLKELSGTAASEGEVARVMKGVPSDQDKSPEVFEAKARATTKFITRAIMRANWALKNGIGVQSVDQLAKAMPLEGIDAVYEKRANEIWQELGGTPESKAEAIRRANQEFGVAR
jgi:hypothetical protein